MSPRQRRGEVTADRLLDAALEVFAAQGRPGFTVQSVLATSGVSLGSLYHHFGSFDGLAAALYSRCMAALFDDLTAAVARTRTARTGVQALVRAYLQFAGRNPSAAGFIHASAGSTYLAANADEVRAAKAPRFEAVAGRLRAWRAAGELADVPDALIEMLLIGPPAETVRRWLAGAPGLDLAQAERVLPERVWQSLAPAA